MKQIYSLFTVLFLLSILLFSCSEENEEGCDIIKSAENNKYSVVIDSGSSAESRAITDLVQGGGNYSEGSLVKLYTKDRKFMATAVGSAGTTWLQNGDPNSTTILTSSINQDWSVAIKYYSDVILDCTAPGGDGSKVTKALEVGSQLPDPVVTAGYTFEGWYEGGTRVYIVPESSNRTFTAKFKQNIKEITIKLTTTWLPVEDNESYYYACKALILTANTTDFISFVINGTQMKSPSAVRYPVTIKNDGKYYEYWEECEYRNGNWTKLSGDGCKMQNFSIIINGTYITMNAALDPWEHGLPNRLNGSTYTKENIKCTLFLAY